MTTEELIEAAHQAGARKCENWEDGGWEVTHMDVTPEQLTAFAAAIIAQHEAQRQAEPESRHVLQADGKHPAPCAKFCEATAFKHEIRHLERDKDAEIAALRQDAERYRWLIEGKRSKRIWNHVLHDFETEGHNNLEAVIDAAMAQAVQPEVRIYPGGGLAHDPLADVCGVAAHVRNAQAVQ